MSVEAAQRWAKETTEEQICVGSRLWKEPLSLGSKGRSGVGERSSKAVCGEQPTAGCEAGDPYPICCLDQRQWAQQGMLHGASQQAGGTGKEGPQS